METNAQLLFNKFLNNQCSPEEAEQLIHLLSANDEDSIYRDMVLAQLASPVKEEAISQELQSRLDQRLQQILAGDTPVIQLQPTAKRNNYLKYAAAAIILLCLSFGAYLFLHQPEVKLVADNQLHDIAPGGNKAVLILANGKKISLTDARNGTLASQPGVQITKTSAGQLIYTASDSKTENDAIEYNTVETPKGGQYQVNLPDGTKVWLNAASSLKYPSTFERSVNRKVELSGEAYFEVAKDKKHPFIVTTNKQEVEVLGTHFNINSYADEEIVKTTLLEGSVRVSLKSAQTARRAKSVILVPNQQASVTGSSNISVDDVTAENAVAWKNGLFMFNDEPLAEVMQKISRWYGVTVSITDPGLYQQTVYGTISRYSNVSKVLNMLEKTGEMQFEITGNVIKVKRK